MATGMSCYEFDDEEKGAENWRRACPTRTTNILLKGRGWFAGSAGGWVHSRFHMGRIGRGSHWALLAAGLVCVLFLVGAVQHQGQKRRK